MSAFSPQRKPPVSATGPGGSWTWCPWHVWLLLAGVLLRLGYGLTLERESAFGGWDGKEFHAYAQSLMRFQGDDYPRYFDCVRAPFYPIFLIPFVALNPAIVWPIQLAQAFLGALQAWVLGRLTARWAGAQAGCWAFAVAVLHPIFIYQSALVLTECLFITLLWGGMACLQRWAESPPADPWRWLTWAGVLLGLACLTRPALQPFLVVAVLWLGFTSWRGQGWRPAFLQMSGFTAVASALLLPWLLGNFRAHHEFTLAPRNAPMAYALGRSPEYLATYEARTKEDYYRALNQIMEKISIHSRSTPVDWVAESKRFQREHPSEWRRLQWHKLVHFWTPWLNPLIFSRLQFVISLLWLTPMFGLAAMELWRRRRRLDAFLWLLIGLIAVGYLVGGYLFQVQVRYRIPFVDVAFLVLGASWLGQWGGKARRDVAEPA